MPTRTERFLEMPPAAPGTLRLLKAITYGRPDARPVAYLQAGLHADELPGMMVLHKLGKLLDAIDANDGITGRIVMVPVANPIGLAQRMQGTILGRLEFESGRNFNRGHGDLTAAAASRLEGKLSDDAEANRALVREALAHAVTEMPATDEAAWLRRTLLGMAITADICLDLHCDTEAVLHMYTLTGSWPRAANLAARLGCEAVFLAEVSGGNPFDEAVSRPWFELAAHFPGAPLPPAPLSATVELRGAADVDEALAERDAANLVAFLREEGIIGGSPEAEPGAPCEATPLAGVEHLRATTAGLVSHLVKVGERVTRGQVVARIIDPLASFGEGVTELAAGQDGLVYARTHHRMATPGMVVTGIAGREPVPGREGGHLLTD